MIEAESTIPKSQLSNEKEAPDRVSPIIEAVACVCDGSQLAHATDDGDVDEGPSVRSVTFDAIGAEFAAVADVPGGKGWPDGASNFDWAMTDNLATVNRGRCGGSDHADLKLVDLCSIGHRAAWLAKQIRTGSRAQKRLAPGWRDRLRAIERLQHASLEAALHIQATNLHGIMAKCLSNQYAKRDMRRTYRKDLIQSAFWDYLGIVFDKPDRTNTA